MQEAVENGIISNTVMAKLQNDVEMAKKKKYLDMHQNKIYQGKDGRWYTRMPKAGGGTKQTAFRSLEDAQKAIISFYSIVDSNPTIKELFDEELFIQNPPISQDLIYPIENLRRYI